MGIYLYAYWPEWQPWENTLLYLPLESDVVDQSWQATTRVFTTSSLSYTTVWWVPSVHIWSTGWIKLTTPYPLQSDVTKPMTLSILVYITNWQISTRRAIFDIAATNWNRLFWAFKENTNNIQFWNQDTDIYAQFTDYINNWMHIVVTWSVWNPLKMYINWELKTTWWTNLTRPRWNWPYSHDNAQWILCDRNVNSYGDGLNWNARELILEDAEWTAQEVADYYTRIKSKLWI